MSRIEKVNTFVLRHRLAERFRFAQWEYAERRVCLVKVTAQGGAFGWGEGYGPAGVVRAGIDFLAPLLLGRDPLEQETLWQAMFRRSFDFARQGVLLGALSALDVALWDLKGKLLDQPVSVLLGGRKRESVRAYATGLYFRECADLPAALAAEAAAHRAAGFDAVKMKVGLGVEHDHANVRAVREALGPNAALMIDANHAFSGVEAADLARRAAPHGIAWFEEPLSPDDCDGYAELRRKTAIPIAAGECEARRAGFLRLFNGRCVDIAQPDICAAGGLTETKKIADMAYTFGVELAPHCWGTGIAMAAALHLLGNLDVVPGRLEERDPWLEFDRTENSLRDELTQPAFRAQNGRVAVPDRPGLGIEVDQGALERYGEAERSKV
ncbi:MAG: mandelate racemase/muconate lactonizing enzyme family protein [Kiritimatiellae bacterium]|nr:mandelate racemase/muconate lactonizing enzyme family protein [Kiritimatiellia bacterium]